MGSDLVTQWAFPMRNATQRLVPYSENKGYASNPRRFIILDTFEIEERKKSKLHHRQATQGHNGQGPFH